MIQLQRFQSILAYLTENPILSVEGAIELTHASPATIRRDFERMANDRLVRRVRGGVALLKPGPSEMVPIKLREIRFPAEKRALAIRAAALLRPGDAAIVDGGTTTLMLAGGIPDIPLRIITNSVRFVSELEARQPDHPQLEIYVTGGILHPHSGLLLGPRTEASISEYHAQWAFLSVSGITERGSFNTNELVIGTERAMIKSAEKVVILADHSKIGRPALCAGARLDEIDVLITDFWGENEPILNVIEGAGIEVIRVPNVAGPQIARTE
jgi:DeoR/GlpR family transcriptional regulator of sugar metabolism